MSQAEVIERLLAECEEKLGRVRASYGEELRKPLKERNVQFLRFLDKEQSVYGFALKVLREVRESR